MSRATPRGRDSYRHFNNITTRWVDNDAYGYVNNVAYYAWFDSAVNQWLVGQGLLDIDAGDPIGLVVETGCRYFAPLAFPGKVEIGMAIERLGRSSVTYRLGVFAAGAEAPRPKVTSTMSMSAATAAVRSAPARMARAAKRVNVSALSPRHTPG